MINSPLNNKHIILTRSLDQMSDAKSLFVKNGAIIFDLPALSINYPNDVRPLDEALLEIENFHWIIFSSSNGIKYVDDRLKFHGSSLKDCSKKNKIAVVGRKTAEYLIQMGIEPSFVPPDYVAESLIENFPVSGYGLKVFLPRVKTGGRNIISDAFRESGARVVEVPAYETNCPTTIPVSTLQAINDRKIDAIIFASGKTVRNCSHLLEKYFGKSWLLQIKDAKFLTIGPQTSKVCVDLFGRVDKQAEEYTFEGLLIAAKEIFK